MEILKSANVGVRPYNNPLKQVIELKKTEPVHTNTSLLFII